jgi:demethylmenaquinone methyltransferase/2-methoxy-6-polyprenyl-1,4-benzoquinol methylase
MVYMSEPEDFSSEPHPWTSKDLSNPHEMEDKHERVEKMFTAIARKYDLNNRIHSLWRDQVWRARAVQAAQLKGDEEVLDVACGTGDLAMAFYLANVKSVIGIDFTKAMLDLAIAKANDSKFDIDYRQGDAMQLDVPSNSVDVVSIAFGIRNVQHPHKAFAEFYRVLRKGGRLIVLEFSTPNNPIIRFFNNFYTKKLMPITATLIARDTSGAYRYLPKSVESFIEPEELSKEIDSAGFANVKQTPQTFGVCTITRAIKN